MSIDVTTKIAYGIRATVKAGVAFDRFSYEMSLKHIDIASFGNHTYEDEDNMDTVVLVKSSVHRFDGFHADDLPVLKAPVFNNEVLAELDDARNYFDFGDVSEFRWIIGRYLT